MLIWSRSRGNALGLIACLVLVACQGSVGLKSRTGEDSAPQPVEQLRGVESLSRQTQQLLRLYDLADKLPKYPTAVVAVLGGLRGSELQHVALAAEAEVAMLTARSVPEAAAVDAAGWYLLAAARAFEFMFGGDYTLMERAMDPRFQRMRRVYNVSVSSYVGLLKETLGGIRSHEQATRFEIFQVDIQVGSERLNPQAADRLLVARDLEIRGLRNRYLREGLGAALVSYRTNDQGGPLDRFYPREGYVDPVTALLEFGPRVAGVLGEARSVTLSFYDPRETETVQVDGVEVPLQADLTTHNAYFASISSLRGMGRRGLLNPDEHDEMMGLYLLEAYDPERIPVVMVHGLRASPLGWMELSNDLYGDPLLRSRFQIWHFFYPSALPYLYVGRVLRNKLEAIRVELDPEDDDPAMQSMVIVGHSLGGLVTRSVVCDSGLELWDAAFTVAPGELRGAPQDLRWLREMFIFTHEPYIDRVVFVATPHRGAERAASLLGQVSSSIVELPEDLLERAERVRLQNEDLITSEWQEVIKKGPPNSIRALRPSNPLMQKVGSLPVAPGIPYHTIMGSRGRDPTEPISDGWVEYESVHLEGAESELIVPAAHDAHAHPAGIAEIKRILRLHLRSVDAEAQ